MILLHIECDAASLIISGDGTDAILTAEMFNEDTSYFHRCHSPDQLRSAMRLYMSEPEMGNFFELFRDQAYNPSDN